MAGSSRPMPAELAGMEGDAVNGKLTRCRQRLGGKIIRPVTRAAGKKDNIGAA